MRTQTLVDMWTDFKSRPVNMTIDKYDNMFNTAQKPEDYTFVGQSGLETIVSVLGAAPTRSVESILDYGCGHGRVGRFLRAFFPNARMTFADADPACADFCAQTFDGVALHAPHDFGELEFDQKFDLIWLGSVFTHMDYERMKILFDALFGALTTGGVLVGTFRGNKMYETYLRNPEAAARDADLISAYKKTGIAYKRYPNWPYDWGLSLVKPFRIMELGERQPDARLVAYTEVGWANAHDVAAWTNVSPQTIIR